MTPALALFVAAVSEAGHPPIDVVNYGPGHDAAFWAGDALPGWVARKACEILGLEPNPCPTDDGFHLGWRIDVDDVAIIAYELLPVAAEPLGDEADRSA